METEKSKRNYCFDFIKGIACICVVFMHCEFPGVLGTVIQCISRFCVPFFFMISGYFAYNENVKSIYPPCKKIYHILKIITFSSLFYIIISLVKHFALGSSIDFSFMQVIYWLFFNQPFIVAEHLWFLFALLYVYILYEVIQCFDLYKIAYCSIPFLIIGYIVLAQGMYCIGINVPNMFYRNFLVEGFPFFMLGYFLHYKEDKILIRFKNNVLVVLLVLFTALCFRERYFMDRDFGVNICTFPQVTCLFILGMKNAEKYESHILRKIGTKLSMFVYIIHPFVWHTLEDVYSVLSINENNAALYIMPILVLFITMLLSVVVTYILSIFDSRKVSDKK